MVLDRQRLSIRRFCDLLSVVRSSRRRPTGDADSMGESASGDDALGTQLSTNPEIAVHRCAAIALTSWLSACDGGVPYAGR